LSPKITIPRLAIPALKIRRGLFLDTEILGVKIRVPPGDIDLWPEIQLLPEITVFDPEWIVGIVEGMAEWIGNVASGVVDAAIPGIIQAVFNAVEPTLDKWAAEYYERQQKG